MRLLMTADTVGGVWQYSLELARALQCYGVEVHVAAMGGPLSPEQRREAASVRNLDVWESSFRLEWMQDAAVDVQAAGEWLLDIERVLGPDVVQVNGFAHAALPWRVPALLVAHSCVFTWWRAVHGTAAPAAEWATYRDGVLRGLRAARAVVTPTLALLEAMRAEYGEIPNAHVIHNGRAAAGHTPGVKQPLVLAAGRLWDPSKNAGALREAATRVSWPMAAAGAAAGPDGQHFDAGALRLLGTLSSRDLASWLARASIFAAPALYEPFGLGVLEAAHAGCALVLSDIPTFRELWHGAALFVPPRDVDALVEGIGEIIDAPDLCERLGACARARAQAYMPERMADAYYALYSQLTHPPVKAAICA